MASCANGLLGHGVHPLYFLDYFATGHLEVGVAQEVVKGIAEACVGSGCALIGESCILYIGVMENLQPSSCLDLSRNRGSYAFFLSSSSLTVKNVTFDGEYVKGAKEYIVYITP